VADERYRGKLKFWSPDRAFGFVEPDSGGPSLFLHKTATSLGSRTPAVGDALTYEVEEVEGRSPRALRAIFAAYPPTRTGRETRQLDA
jgi:cold shock CspA family protein